MLIMVLAQAQATGNGTLINSYVSEPQSLHVCSVDLHDTCLMQYNLLKGWGNYLVTDQLALFPGSNQYVPFPHFPR